MTTASGAPSPATTAEELLAQLARRYVWDAIPHVAPTEAKVVLRTMDFGTWDDILLMEQKLGLLRLRNALGQAPAGALSHRSWHFWHYRLGLATLDRPPPPPPFRKIG